RATFLKLDPQLMDALIPSAELSNVGAQDQTLSIEERLSELFHKLDSAGGELTGRKSYDHGVDSGPVPEAPGTERHGLTARVVASIFGTSPDAFSVAEIEAGATFARGISSPYASPA